MKFLIILLLFLSSLNTFASTVILAKGRSAIITLAGLEREYVGMKLYIANKEKIIGVATITKIIKEDIKALVKITKGSALVNNRVFTTVRSAYDWINDDGKSELGKLIPDFLKDDGEDDEDEDEDEDFVEEDSAAIAAVTPDTDYDFAVSGHAGTGTNQDGSLVRFGATAYYQPSDTLYYLATFDYSTLTYEIAPFSVGGGVSTLLTQASYNYLQFGGGLGFSLGSFFVELLGGYGLYSSDIDLDTNSADNVNYATASSAFWYGARGGYRKSFGRFFVNILGGYSLVSGTMESAITYNGVISNGESDLSDTEMYFTFGLGFQF
jgi:hypothetical protein